MENDLLKIYLNDHLAGAQGGVELAQRCQANNEGTPLGDFLATATEDIEEDLKTLERMMEELDIPKNPAKQAGVWLSEKVGRLKLNERIKGYSDLSRLVELETLRLGVEGKASLWRSLLQVEHEYAALGNFDVAELLTRAETQRDALEKYRQEAAVKALGITAGG